MRLRSYLFSALLSLPAAMWAQEAIYLADNAQMSIGSADKMAVFGNMQLDGQLHSAAQGELQFYGQNWQQGPAAQLPGEGEIQFIQPNTLYNQQQSQQLAAASASLPKLMLNNSEGLYLLGEDAHVRQQLDLQVGLLFLDGQNLRLGDNGQAPTLLSYGDNSFVVSQGIPGSADGDFLIIEGLGNGESKDFPLGLAAGEYSPAQISNQGDLDAYWVRLFANVYENGEMGALRNDASVGRTWEIREEQMGGSDLSLQLQSNSNMFGPDFNANEQQIVRYIGTWPNNLGGAPSMEEIGAWDNTGNCQPFISGGLGNSNGQLSLREGLDNFTDYTFYTVYNCKADFEFVVPSAFSPNDDGINDLWVIDLISLQEKRQVQIFNRWGDIVFESDDYQNNWNGKFGGQILPDGTYYYVINLGGSLGRLTGPVTIVRN